MDEELKKRVAKRVSGSLRDKYSNLAQNIMREVESQYTESDKKASVTHILKPNRQAIA